MPNAAVVQSLRSRLPDAFSVQMLDGALAALAGDNPLRAQHFAVTVRELFGHVLDVRAPETDVTRCDWFRQEKNTTRPTRKQRALYAARGGLHDEFIEDELGLDTNSMHGQLTNAYAELNKRSHVRPSTVLTDRAEIEYFADMAISALSEVFDTVRDVREQIEQAIEGRLHDETMEIFVRDTIQNLDEMATHYTTGIVWLDELNVSGIDADLIRYYVAGSVEVQLQYGSNSDVRRGDGALLDKSFPFSCRIAARVSDPFEFIQAMTETKVDTSSWYGTNEAVEAATI